MSDSTFNNFSLYAQGFDKLQMEASGEELDHLKACICGQEDGRIGLTANSDGECAISLYAFSPHRGFIEVASLGIDPAQLRRFCNAVLASLDLVTVNDEAIHALARA